MNAVYPSEYERVLPALRELLGDHPRTVDYSPKTLVSRLLSYLPQPPTPHEVETPLEALSVEGEVLA